MATVEKVVTTVAATNASKTTNKHSMCFHISARGLFNNRRLKQKRMKWARAIPHNSKKTEPTLYINLLSDEEDNDVQQQQQPFEEQSNYCYERQLLLKPISKTEPPPLVPISTPATSVKNFQHVLVYQQHGDHVSNVPQIAYIPVPPLSVSSFNNNVTSQIAGIPAKTTLKKRRKHPTVTKFISPTIINECIVLSDDEDLTTTATTPCNNNNNAVASKNSPVIPLLPELTLTAISYQQNSNNINNNNENLNENVDKFTQDITNVHEEVTVSLVPRKNNINAQIIEQTKQQKQLKSNVNKKQTFPMLPDETTVHTVIADRIYEMPLTKLREGLVHGKSAQPIGMSNSTDAFKSQAPPISLKLSSDLSISLISDDEGDEPELDKDLEARLSAEKLRRTQPQLSVQEVNLVGTSPTIKPKRRKLG